MLIGLVLKNLYTFSPYFPWYAFYHFIVHFISMVVLLYAVLYKRFSWTRFSFFFVYFVGLELYFLNNIQFTITSFVAGQSGIFLFLTFINEKSLKAWIMMGISLFLLVISFLVRYNSFYLICLFNYQPVAGLAVRTVVLFAAKLYPIIHTINCVWQPTFWRLRLNNPARLRL